MNQKQIIKNKRVIYIYIYIYIYMEHTYQYAWIIHFLTPPIPMLLEVRLLFFPTTTKNLRRM